MGASGAHGLTAQDALACTRAGFNGLDTSRLLGIRRFAVMGALVWIMNKRVSAL